MKIVEIQSNIKNGRILCESICKDLTKQQRVIVEGIYKDLEPLMEMELTAPQITQLFKDLEQANSGERTMLGKGVDAAKYVNDTINKVGRWLQDTAPVKAFDQKYQSLITDISNKLGADSKVVSYTKQLGQFAKNNPGKTAAIIGVLTTVAAIAGGPLGGAIAGQVLRGTAELLKGEKLSTAIGKGVKTAAVGALVGMGLEKIGDAIKDGINFVREKTGAGWVYSARMEVNGVTTFDGVRMLKPEADLAGQINDQIYQAAMKDDTDALVRAIIKMEKLTELVGTDQYIAKVTDNAELARIMSRNANLAQQTFKDIGAVAQGAITAKMDTKQQGVQPNTALKESQILALFNVVANLNNRLIVEGRLVEGPLWDKIKSGAKSLVSKTGQKIAQIGKNITTKVTADKLMTAWKAAGSPTDSDAVADIIKKSGVSDQVISTVYRANNIAYDPLFSPTTDYTKTSTGNQPTVNTQQPISVGGQKINPNDPRYQKLLQKVQNQTGTQTSQPQARSTPTPKRTPGKEEQTINDLVKKLNTLTTQEKMIYLKRTEEVERKRAIAAKRKLQRQNRVLKKNIKSLGKTGQSVPITGKHPIFIGGQKIDTKDPRYEKLLKQLSAQETQ